MPVETKKMSIVPTKSVKDDSVKRPSVVIADRMSKELVIAFSGPIGCGINAVKQRLEDILLSSGYKVHHIKLSDYLKEVASKGVFAIKDKLAENGADRYIQMQDVGNALRKVQPDILAEYSIGKIAEIRTTELGEQTETVDDIIPERTAYIIDQLKHPEEVTLMRAVYGNLFYLFGVLSITQRRESRLLEEKVELNRISDLIERDRRQIEKNGQQLDKTLQLADFFIRNDQSNAETLNAQIKRFVDLIHGANGITPTLEEYGMYMAYAAGLRSACLSRQVGASIMNSDGTVISTGRNDVPKAGGGLYGPESGKDDARCVKLELGICHNDKHKKKLVDDIKTVIRSELERHISGLIKEDGTNKLVLEKLDIKGLSDNIEKIAYADTRLSGLIEFSRSIHAEMDAIVSLALKGGGSTKGGFLFTYTFPCHNCARHIVAAGIQTVYFLEPYEKSLALDLHHDAISLDGVSSLEAGGVVNNSKVIFIHFEGVSPRQYMNMFNPSGERKDDQGKAVRVNINDADKKVPAYLDSYKHYELKVVAHLTQIMNDLNQKGLPS